MSVANRYNELMPALCAGQINLTTDVIKVLLSNRQPLPGDNFANVAEITGAGGYAAQVVSKTVTDLNGVVTITATADPVFTATGAMDEFRYFIYYNETAGKLMYWFDRGSALTLVNAGETYTIDVAKIADFG